MHHISKSAIVPYTCEQMFTLVNQVEKYPDFLNWCSGAFILNQTDEQIKASVKINKGAFNQSFTTLNRVYPFEKINMQLEDGPFSHLSGDWLFVPLGEDACKVSLELQFSFASKIMDMAISPVFTSIANSQLDAFVTRAKSTYG